VIAATAMTFTPSPDNILWLFSTIAKLALLVRLIRTDLFRIYRVLFVYLLAEILRFAAYLWLSPNKTEYARQFFLSQPVTWLLEAWVLVELCFLIFRNHQGLARTSKWLIALGFWGAFIISVVTAFLSAAPIADKNDPHRVLFYYTAVERTLDIGMVLFLLVMTIFLCWFPIVLNRNVLVYFASWSFSFIARSAAVIVPFATGHRMTHRASLVLQGIDLVCVSVWLVLINKAGENVETVSGYDWQPEQREHIRAQLQAMNAYLENSKRR
jgi:hypothetical protein